MLVGCLCTGAMVLRPFLLQVELVEAKMQLENEQSTSDVEASSHDLVSSISRRINHLETRKIR